MLSTLLMICCGTAYILEAWLDTNVLIEYAVLFNITNILYIDDFLELRKNGFNESYLSFLQEYHNSFFVKLITCPTCLSFWLNIVNISIISFLLNDVFMLMYLFPMSFLTLFLYRLLNKLV